eukprot:934855-Ditylum_brightwellii.AAC.1
MHSSCLLLRRQYTQQISSRESHVQLLVNGQLIHLEWQELIVQDTIMRSTENRVAFLHLFKMLCLRRMDFLLLMLDLMLLLLVLPI